MSFDYEYHRESFVPWPSLAITRGQCGDPSCDSRHYQIQLSFLFWTCLLTFSLT